MVVDAYVNNETIESKLNYGDATWQSSDYSPQPGHIMHLVNLYLNS